MADEEGKGEKRARTKRTRGVIDRLEDGGLAVVRAGDDEGEELHLPASLLPEGAGDGDHLTITVALDEGARAKRAASIQERLKRLGGDQTAGQKDFKL